MHAAPATAQTALSAQDRRAAIDSLQASLQRLPQIEVPTDHTFGPGFYARTIHLKAGDELVGLVHTTEHLFILSAGELLVVTEDGGDHLRAPFQAVCRPGLKRAGKALTDCTVTNIHITPERDLDKLRLALVESEPLIEHRNSVALEG